MKDVAHISFPGGGLIVPAHTPYERQLLFEHVEGSVKRHGRVGFEVNRQHWTISLNNGQGKACAACTRRANSMTYRFDGQTLCGQCARRALR